MLIIFEIKFKIIKIIKKLNFKVKYVYVYKYMKGKLKKILWVIKKEKEDLKLNLMVICIGNMFFVKFLFK